MELSLRFALLREIKADSFVRVFNTFGLSPLSSIISLYLLKHILSKHFNYRHQLLKVGLLVA